MKKIIYFLPKNLEQKYGRRRPRRKWLERSIAQAIKTEEPHRTSAQAAGFSVRNAQMLGAMRVTIDIDAARAPALFGWLAGLEPQGVFVEQARLATRSDASLGVELVLRGVTP